MKYFKRPRKTDVKDPRLPDENIEHKQIHTLRFKKRPHNEMWYTAIILILTVIACVIIANF